MRYFAMLAVLMPALGVPALAQDRAGHYVPYASSLKDDRLAPARGQGMVIDTYQHHWGALRLGWGCISDRADVQLECTVAVKPPRAPGRSENAPLGAR